jgi:hypothetical protein
MRVVKRNVVDKFLSANPHHALAVEDWWDRAETATWFGDGDVTTTFPAATGGGSSWAFPLSGGVQVDAIVTYETASATGVVSVSRVS